YHPAFAGEIYFPSIGEIALTVGLISLLIFLYRFFVNYFPILPVLEKTPPVSSTVSKGVSAPQEPVRPVIAWVFRASAAVFLISFVILYSVVHHTAIAESKLTYGEVFAGKASSTDQAERTSFSHQFRPEKYRNFYVLNSPILNSATDYYESVRFSHRTHDDNVDGNCAVCHHRYSDGPSDRVGEDLKELHASIEVRIGGGCVTCHED
ncbi:MAG: hypothetical protein GY950_34515, partial [bacterium]|nr:hypothetical protein [bacterium]